MENDVYHQFHAVEEHHWWFRGRRRVLLRVLQALLPPCPGPQPRTVLEVGCGTGGNLPLLATLGRVSAMELDAGARARAQARGLCEVRSGHLPDAVPFHTTFDLVCALDVVEHVADDVAALRALADRLAPQGRLLVTVPAYGFLWSQHDVRNHHHRRYTRGQLLRAMAQAGLRVHYASYFNCWLFPAALASRGLQRLLRRPLGDELALPHPAINRLLERVLASEGALLPRIRLPFGLSVVAVATRPAPPTA
ncbi:class I SAM-dependent methyltransferase [Ideonella livida]|uniref:Class I SAM-dependent methyltransferase n=1 Tax=Ideonella livida TaxID=2707176 RepID=A0A7C9PJP7_9BURK|nr:class I SAM-dependent methyltransferase [Ideonella livida]NDY92752.1 class I SAM-dependent methyltransferase [Ideonella livida]